MQVKHLLPTALFLFCSIPAIHAQRENVWVFGSKAGIDFNGKTPAPFSTHITPQGGSSVQEANASVCDANGQFLFYTDGNTVWNKNDDTMFNGKNLVAPNNSVNYSNKPENIYSTTQGALIVPMPDSTDKYYIFSLTSTTVGDTNKALGYLYYSIVNMTLNNGLGAVESGRKGILLDSGLREGMTSVVGDRCNVWVLVCDHTPHFRAYEITASGLNKNPVISAVGIGGYATQLGMIAVSPDRTKIAAGQGGYFDLSGGTSYSDAAVALFDFNPVSGVVSNPVKLFPFYTPLAYNPLLLGWGLGHDSTAYGVCFSPDGSKLYVTTQFASGSLYQFDLSSGDPNQMSQSRTYIGPLKSLAQLKLAPDGKIYFPTQYSNPPTLGSINTPNLPGAACKFVPKSIVLPSGCEIAPGLPNVVSVFQRDTVHTTRTVTSCGNTMLVAADTTGWDYVWNNNAPGMNKKADTSGTYWVSYHISPCNFNTDTFIVSLVNLAPVIRVSGFDLSTTISYDTYQWYLDDNLIPGATNRIYTVTQNGNYTVVVSDNASGCTDTSAIYKVTNVTDINSINKLRTAIKVYPNPASEVIHIKSPVTVNAVVTDIEGKQIRKVPNAKIIDVNDLAEGIYLIHVYDPDNVLLKVAKFIKVIPN